MSRGATLSINDNLVIQAWSTDTNAAVTIKLNRLSLQNFVDALLEHSGVRTKSRNRGFESTFAVIDQTPLPAKARPAPRVKVGGPKILRLGK